MVFKNLLRRKTRSILTLVGIAIGVAAVVALGALAEGFINSYTTILTSSGADIIVTQSDAPDILFSAVDSTMGPRLKNIAGVRQISGVLMGMISTPDVPYFIIFGLDPEEFGIGHYKVVEGKPITGARQMIMGRASARNFRKKVGDYYKIQDASYKIVGLYETGQSVEETGGVITLAEAQEIFKKPDQVAYYQIKLERPEMTDRVIQEMERRFPKLAAARSANYMDNQAETTMLRAMGWFIGILAIAGGGLVMMNTMLMSVFERTREIGVLRALGWRRGRVVRMIAAEALLLSLIGGVIGIAAGVALAMAINQIPVIAGFLDNTLTPALFAQGLIVAVFLGIAGGLYPAWRASRLQPAEAMRQDGSGGKPGMARWQIGGMALRNILRQRTRTILTMLAIGIGVGLVVAMGGIGEGLVREFTAIGSQGGDLTIMEAKASDMSLAAIDEKVGRYAASLPQVEHVSGMLLGIAAVPGSPFFLVLGLDPTSFSIGHFAITEGERMRLPQEIILGKIAAKNMNKHPGDTFKINNASYRVAGIYETGISYEDSGAVMALVQAQRAFKKPNQVSAYGLKLRDLDQEAVVRRQIEGKFSQVSVSRSTEFVEKTNDINTFRTETNALSMVSILIGGVGMMNAMLMSVYERTREIGTLRALGWRRRRVIGMIVREAILLSLLSGVAGIILGIGLGTLIGMEPTVGSYLKSAYTPTLLAQAMVLALVLGVTGAIYPAWRASNLSPIEALRYE